MLVVIVVLFVAYANHDRQSYAFSNEINDIFVKGKISKFNLSMVGYRLLLTQINFSSHFEVF